MTDPTVAAPVLPDDPSAFLTVSLSEIEAMAKKASRGAGFSWGMAEEAAFATRWLAAHRLPGPETLVSLLRSIPTEEHCPLTIGVWIADRAQSLVGGEAIAIDSVDAPVMLLPFLAQVARRHDCPVRIDDIVVTGEGVTEQGLEKLAVVPQAAVDISAAKARPSGDARSATAGGYPVAIEVWEGLDGFAKQTYVPASEASRTAGAGAGLTDND